MRRLLAVPDAERDAELWPNFRSPLIWDVFAVSTYVTVSLLFWYVGLVPDLATLRDRATHQVPPDHLRAAQPRLARLEPSLAALRARVPDPGGALDAAGALACTRIVSFDFATSVMPGWHTTIFPPYFVAGAVFSGFAMVMTLMVTRALGLRAAEPDHDQAPREHVQGDAGHRHDRGVDGTLFGGGH